MTTPTDKPRDTLATRYARFIVRFRVPVALLTIALSVWIGSHATRLGLATNYRVFFGPDNPELTAFEALEDIYTKNDGILFVLQPEQGSVFSPQMLGAISELTREAWQIPFATRVDSITNFQHTEAEGDDLTVADLLPEGVTVTPAISERVRRVSTAEPMIAGRLISHDGRTTGVNVRLQLPGDSADELPQAAAYARALAERVRAAQPGVRVELSGFAMLNNAFSESPQRDARFAMPIMFAVFVVVLALVLRSTLGTVITLGLVTLANLLALGWAGARDMMLDPASASAPVIILTIAVASAVHILKAAFQSMARGVPRREAMVESLRVNAQPVLLTSLTTLVGFLVLNFSDSPPFQHLGNISAVGVVAAWVLSMTFLPAAFAILPVKAPATGDRSSGLIGRLSDFVVRKRRRVLAVGAVIAAGLVAAIPTLEVNDKAVEYFGEVLDIRRASDFTMDNLSGVYTTSFSVDSGRPGGVAEPGYLERVDAFTQWLRQQPGVVHVASFTDTMRRLNRNMHGDEAGTYVLPKERELASQYLLLYEMSLPYGLDVGDQIDIDKRSLRVDVTYGDVDQMTIQQGARDAQAWLRREAADEVEEVSVGGPMLMFANITQRNIDSMVGGTAFGFVLIAVILVLALRSTRLGLLSLVPNVLPAAMAFGIWALTQGEVGFAISIVSGLSLGIIVDDTVHFLAKYAHAREQLGRDPASAVRYAFDTVGGALLGTTVIVALGFSMLALSSFRVTAYMGTLTALTVVCALLTDLFLLPALLVTLDRSATPARGHAPAVNMTEGGAATTS